MSGELYGFSKAIRLGGALLLIFLICLEVSVSIVKAIAPKLFGETAAVLSAIESIEPEKFTDVASRARGNPAVWEATEGTTTTTSCLGKEYQATYDAMGARNYPGYDAKLATTLLIGDSYTAGDEVDDEHTVAAHLSRQTGVIAANLGVGGYGPLQAVLKLEEKAKHFPAAKVVVLGVMFENIRRNVNSYMAVFTGPEGKFAVRPYVRDGEVNLVPSEIFDNIDQFKAYAKSALASDFWATPQAAFPNTVAIFELIRSKGFWIRNKSRVLKAFGRQYAPDFKNSELARSLEVVVTRFGEAAKAANLRPLVVFIPQNRFDLDAPARWIEDYQRAYGGGIKIQIMEVGAVDWARYNQKPDGSCHPSAYGYDMIARAYATALSD